MVPSCVGLPGTVVHGVRYPSGGFCIYPTLSSPRIGRAVTRAFAALVNFLGVSLVERIGDTKLNNARQRGKGG